LDDVVLGGMVEALAVELLIFSAASLEVGLVLNESKFEIIGLNSSVRPKWEETGFNTSFREPSLSEAVLHGAPFFDVGLESKLRSHIVIFDKVGVRLHLLSSHESFFIKSC